MKNFQKLQQSVNLKFKCLPLFLKKYYPFVFRLQANVDLRQGASDSLNKDRKCKRRHSTQGSKFQSM